ncbi:MAG: PfkB family carbohydrate kinase [Nitrospinota bacterium]
MSLLAVGTLGYDDIKTPFGTRKRVLGGSGAHFALSATFFTKVMLVAVIGNDFKSDDFELLASRNIDTDGVQELEGKSFHWSGEYGYDLSEAQTLSTDINVLAKFHPALPEHYEDAKYIFLGNIAPNLQMEVLEQVKNPTLISLDSMDFWIKNDRQRLIEMIKKIDILLINEGEARMLTGEPNLTKAAKYLESLGVKIIVIKRGEYGALLFSENDIFSAPAYPLEHVFDPTGAGDSFAGGFMGSLARKQATESLNAKDLRQAIIAGSVMASFAVEKFGVERVSKLKKQEILERFNRFKHLTHFDPIDTNLS